MKLSALVITFNEEKHIEQCIRSLKKVSDEVVVVDSNSTDKTPEICKKLGVKLIPNTYHGQIEQKNFALSKATFDYILSIDADEMLTDDLAMAIQIEKDHGFPFDGYYMNRLNNYDGKWIRHGGWYPEWKLRLWKRDKGIWAGENPHDQVKISTQNTTRLKGHLLHYAYDSVAEHRRRIPSYAEIGARSLHRNGKKFFVWQLIFSPSVKFIKDYVLRLGFLDGSIGWTIARLSAKTKFLKYKKLKTLQNQKQ